MNSAKFPKPVPNENVLVKNNLGLAQKYAWQYSKKTGQPYDELEAIATLGLLRGVRVYDPKKINPKSGEPYKISTILVPFINGEILHHFRDHGYQIKFPSKWREKWGKVKRLMADSTLSAQDVALQSGLDESEIEEMCNAMTPIHNLDDIHGSDGYDEAEISEDRLTPLMKLVNKAWDNLSIPDRGLFLKWWGSPGKVAFPFGPMQQYHRRLKTILSGRRLSDYQQIELGIVVDRTIKTTERRRKERKEMADAGMQLGLQW